MHYGIQEQRLLPAPFQLMCILCTRASFRPMLGLRGVVLNHCTHDKQCMLERLLHMFQFLQVRKVFVHENIVRPVLTHP